MKKNIIKIMSCIGVINASAQSPELSAWLINNTTYGSHYVSGNSTVIQDSDLANVQSVQYSNNWVYVSTEGVPAYPTGPFLDGNPSIATAQGAIFKISRNPTANTGTGTETVAGNIGIFINGTALFDYRDGVSYSFSAGMDQGGPGGSQGDGIWNRDAVVAERDGFDCSKGHPAMGNYHHHQNPTAFKLDLNVTSTICNLYDADGLYMMDSTEHSPLIGFAYDGYPIYGAYGYRNTDGTGGIARMKSSYILRNITTRTHYADGTDVTDGPAVNSTYPLGQYREDYEYISSTQPDRLDEHNGRFCVTPEYPNGTYAYFATVNSDWTSAYPYLIGPAYYGVVNGGTVNAISEPVTNYTSLEEEFLIEDNFTVFPNPTSNFIAVQSKGLVKSDISLKLYDLKGSLVRSSTIKQGSTLFYIDTRTLYAGQYILEISNNESRFSRSVILTK